MDLAGFWGEQLLLGPLKESIDDFILNGFEIKWSAVSWSNSLCDVFDTLCYGFDWCSALLTVMLLSFIWNLLYLKLDSQFSLSGSSGTCGESTETAACRWEEVDEARVGIPGAGKVTNGLDPRVRAMSPGGPGRSHVSSLESLICPAHILHIPWYPASGARALGQECFPRFRGISQ